MPRTSLLIAILSLFSFSIFAQKANVSGVLTDGNEKTPVYNSVVALLTPKDSILYRFTRTDKKGNFDLKNVKAGNYIVMTSHRQYADYLDDITVSETTKNLGTIDVVSKINALREVIIKTGAILCKNNTNKLKSISHIPIIYTQIKNITKTNIPGCVLTQNTKTIVC